MNTQLLNKKDTKEIVNILKSGGMVAIPTDTVYGLAVSSDNPNNYKLLKETKGRPDSKPFPLMVGSLNQLKDLVEMDGLTEHLVDTFMPGAVTFIFKKKEGVFPFLEGQTTLGIRMADDIWVQSLILELGYPIWLPSANKSGEPTGTTSDEVLSQLESKIHGVVLGESDKKESSSVFDLTQDEIKELRRGKIPLEEIQKEVQMYLEKGV